MRAFVLAALVAALVWLGWRAFAPRSEEVAAAPPAELGRAMTAPPEASRPMSAPDARAPGRGEERGPVDPAAGVPRGEPEAADLTTETTVGSGEPAPAADEVPRPGVGGADEIELGRVLAHELQALAARLSAERERLGDERAALVECYADLLEGRLERAQQQGARLTTSTALRYEELTTLERLVDTSRAGGRLAEPLPADRLPPLARGTVLGFDAELAERALEAGESALAARAYTQCLLGELGAPWTPNREALRRWSEGLQRSQEDHRWNPRGDWAGLQIEVEPGDNLIAIRKRALAIRPDLLVCTGQIERANRLRGDVIHPGQILRVPTDRAHVLVDLSARWVVYFLGDEAASAWEIGIGRPGEDTPAGSYTVGEKREEPMWFRRGREPVPFGDPENPLGTRWIGWIEQPGALATSLGFHGTDEPDGIGGAVSDGCVRMRNAEVEAFFEILPRDSEITVRL